MKTHPADKLRAGVRRRCAIRLPGSGIALPPELVLGLALLLGADIGSGGAILCC